MDAIVKSLEEFLGERGLASPISDFMVDKMKVPHGLTQRKRRSLEKEAAEASQQYVKQRKAAVEEYNRLLFEGKIRAPSSIERLLKVAAGHEDNAATQAARRALEKRGIDWRAEIVFKMKEQNMFTFEAEVRFLHEPNLKEYIDNIEKYLRETDYFSLNDKESERYESREEHLRLAKQIYNEHIDEGLVSYKGKTPYDLNYRIELRAEKPSLDSRICNAESKKVAVEVQAPQHNKETERE